MSEVIKIPLSCIRPHKDLQQRKVNGAVVEEFAAIMKEQGVDRFPPISVVYDGTAYWMWDGYHRFAAADSIGAKSMQAESTKATFREALWLSFSANSEHGTPRPDKSTFKIVKKILADDEWSKLTQADIAEHVGVSKQRVSAIVQKLDEAAKPKTTKKKTTTTTTTTTEKEPEVVEDRLGREVPPELTDVFTDAYIVQGFMSELDDFKRRVEASTEKYSKVWHYFRSDAFKANVSNVKRQLKFARPHAVCVYCGGVSSERCNACKGAGYINIDLYTAAPKDLKL